MKIYKVGEEILKQKIDGELWLFVVSDVFQLTQGEYDKNEAYNDALGNYEPEKELPTNSVVTISATNKLGESVELKWSYPAVGVYPHVSRKGWSKALFVKLNQILGSWEYPNA